MRLLLSKQTALALLCAAACLPPASALGCSMCVAALVERVVPPVLPWMVVTLFAWPAVWYATRPAGGSTLGSAGTVILAIFTVIAAAAYFGPIPFLIAMALIAYRLVSAIRREGSRQIKILAAVVALAYLVTAIVPLYREFRRDDADRILRWPSTGPSRQLLQRLEAKRDLPSLRRVLAGPDDFEASNAAAALGRIGVAATDAPLIVERLGVAERDPDSKWMLETFSGALAKLLQKSPSAEKPTAADWERLLSSPPVPSGAGS